MHCGPLNQNFGWAQPPANYLAPHAISLVDLESCFMDFVSVGFLQFARSIVRDLLTNTFLIYSPHLIA